MAAQLLRVSHGIGAASYKVNPMGTRISRYALRAKAMDLRIKTLTQEFEELQQLRERVRRAAQANAARRYSVGLQAAMRGLIHNPAT